MILILCPSAGCYWGTDIGATVEVSAATFVAHWRGKHEPLGQSPLDPGASSDAAPIAGGFVDGQADEGGEG